MFMKLTNQNGAAVCVNFSLVETFQPAINTSKGTIIFMIGQAEDDTPHYEEVQESVDQIFDALLKANLARHTVFTEVG